MRSNAPRTALARLPWKPGDTVTASDATHPDLVIDLDRHGSYREEIIALVVHQLPGTNVFGSTSTTRAGASSLFGVKVMETK